MELEKQKLLVNLLVSNKELMSKCAGIIQPSYFDPALKKSVRFLAEYFAKYKDVPRTELVRAETGLLIEPITDVSRAELRYVADEIETFCRNSAVTEAVMKSPELIRTGDFNTMISDIRTAIAVGLPTDLGMSYFSEPEKRLEKTLVEDNKISTGWPELNAIIGGGLQREELIVFAANSGGGKSMVMLNLAKNLLAQGLHGVYISLEMSEAVVSKRLDSMISCISQEGLAKQIFKVVAAIEHASQTWGQFYIKRMPEGRTTIVEIIAYLTMLEQTVGFRPDFIVVDYLDIMGTTAKIQLDNLFIKDKYVSEEVRSLGLDYNSIMISASQLGRTAIDAEKLTQANIQGGISKINTSDNTVGIIQNDVMRAAGQIGFEGLKMRNSGASRVHRHILKMDPISLNITSTMGKTESLQLNKKTQPAVLGTDSSMFPQKNGGVLDLLQ